MTSKLVRQRIIGVDVASPAENAGVFSGEVLLSINGEPVCDLIDYEYLTANAHLMLRVEDGAGQERTVDIRKGEAEPLGLSFSTSLMSQMRSCCNRCVFCFVDQMPKGLRSSLSVKDDDWRLSFIMGNYVTLTNASDDEFERILRRRVSPLYVSVHATDPAVRESLMQNRTAGRLMERLTRLKAAGIQFHAQIVLCPGWNDGAVLDRSIQELANLYPSAQSVAVVPVGLTRFREGLAELRPADVEAARAIIAHLQPMQERFLRKLDTRFVFLSDEWYLKAGESLPPYTHYEGFDQIENGVGLLRLFEDDFHYALSDQKKLSAPRAFDLAGGTSCAAFFSALYEELAPYGVHITLHPVRNDFFGGNVNVAGLITGSDLMVQLSEKLQTDTLLIPHNMLRECEDVFLDDVKLSTLSETLGVRVLPFSGGEELIHLMFGSR